jgi:site-specific DNA-methyltransferase (adenine-specific)
MPVLEGDCRDLLPGLGFAVDAVVCDPPYHLKATLKRFGQPGSAPAQWGRDGAMARLSAGFMGEAWDGGDIAFRPETWAVIGAAMRPGAFLAAFGGTRTWHRLACAIEDSGLVIQDTLAWVYGSGFPKRRDQLKPAWEPIVLAYRPGGPRALQIEECRVGTEATLRQNHAGTNGAGWRFGKKGHLNGSAQGRWPANFIHDGSQQVLDLFPETVSGSRKAGVYQPLGWYGNRRGRPPGLERPMPALVGSSGSAARYFPNLRIFYSPKASKSERAGSTHPTVKPIALIEWLVRLVTPPGGIVLDPFAGSGTTGLAAMRAGRAAILIEKEPRWVADIHQRLEEAA